MTPDLVQNDTASTLKVTLLDESGAPIDLTGSTVALEYYIESYPPIFNRPMTIATDPTTGVVTYAFRTYQDATGLTQFDLGTAGTLNYRVIITFAGGAVLSTPFLNQISIHELLA